MRFIETLTEYIITIIKIIIIVIKKKKKNTLYKNEQLKINIKSIVTRVTKSPIRCAVSDFDSRR